jgi:CRP-like cAMP-binding protein
MIAENLLLDFGAKKISYAKGDQLFREGDTALNYYQVASGEVKDEQL